MSKKPFDLKTKVKDNNTYYRKVIHTTDTQQLVIMNIPKGQSIGLETHPKTTQFFYIESGKGVATIGKKTYKFKSGESFVVNPGVEHDVKSESTTLKLFTIYSPPEHADKKMEKLKKK